MLQLDFVLKLNSWQMGEYNDPDGYWIYFYRITNAKNTTFLFGWSKNFRCVVHSYTTHPLLHVCVCVCVVYPYAVLDVQRSVPEESIVLSSRHWLAFSESFLREDALKDPDAMFAAHTHATDHTKGFGQRQAHVRRRMTNEITEYAEWNSGDLRSAWKKEFSSGMAK